MLETNAPAPKTELPYTGTGGDKAIEAELSTPQLDARSVDTLRLQASQLLSSEPGADAPAWRKMMRDSGAVVDFRTDGALYGNRKSDFEVEGQNLLKNFQSKASDETVQSVMRWKAEAERRAVSGDLPKDELTATYRQVNRLLNNSSPFMSDAERMNVAAGILYHTGPGRIDQGLHSTCNVTVLQNIAFSERPSVAAEMITTAALDGAWRSPDGKTIKLPQDSMKPGWEEKTFPPDDGLRSHASQIFQVVALNDVGQREKEPKDFVQKPMEISSALYLFGTQMLPAAEYWMPNGYEVWRDASGRETNFNGLSGRQIQEESKRLFGDKFETIAYKSPYESYSHPLSSDANDYKLTKLVDSEKALRQNLTQLKTDGRLPVVVAVNGSNLPSTFSLGEAVIGTARALIRPFKSAHEKLDSLLGVPNHVVTVTKFDQANDKVYVKNSWGKEQDGWISVRDLWKAL